MIMRKHGLRAFTRHTITRRPELKAELAQFEPADSQWTTKRSKLGLNVLELQSRITPAGL